MKKQEKKNKERKFLSYEHLDKIGEIALYYGFTPHQSPEIKKADLDSAKSLLDGDHIDDNEQSKISLPLHVEEKIALLRKYQEDNMHTLNQPVMLYFKEPFKGSIKRNQSNYSRYCDLEIIGSSKSIAEATLIQTARMILAENGFNDICVEINSIGDRESINRFSRDLTNYYRKNINDMDAESRQILKRDPFELLASQTEASKKINENAPKSIDVLSESSRMHFQEVLEYLEALDISFRINNSLIGNRKYCTETIFTITDMNVDNKSDKQRILAVGVRYDGLAKKIGLKKEIQGVGMSILIKNNKQELRKGIKKTKKPFASFVQLGFESKLLSLKIIEDLRRVRIPLCLSLSKDRLGAQVVQVEKQHTEYSIIMGKKEAVEKTVIVRNTNTHAQEIVTLDELAKYMKRLEK